MLYSTHYSSPLGDILLASDGGSLIGLWLDEQKYYCDSITETMKEKSDLPVFSAVKNWWTDTSSGESPLFRNCRWLLPAVSSERLYGIFSAKQTMER
jgi:O6-methylguanine-DNA--protein-cysteine methyltransferase